MIVDQIIHIQFRFIAVMTRMIPTVEAQSAFQVHKKKTYGNSLKDGEGSASPPPAHE